MTLPRLLLWAYPRSWRDEYGVELVSLIERKPLTLPVAAGVLIHGARQRLLRDDPWKICGAFLVLWTLLCLYYGVLSPFGWFLPVLASSFWTVRRNDASLREAVRAALQVALMGAAVEIAYGLIRMLDGSSSLVAALGSGASLRSTITLSTWGYIQVFLPAMVLFSCVAGLAGAIAGRIFVEAVRHSRNA